MSFLNLPSVRGADEPVSGSSLGRILRRAWAVFEDSDDGHVKLKKPDDSVIDLETGGGGGSGFVPARNVGQVELDFNGLAVTAGQTGTATLVFSDGDEAMFDLSTPTAPAPVESGVYAYNLLVTRNNGGDGGPYNAKLHVDDDWYSIDNTFRFENEASVTTVWYSDAGSSCSVSILNSQNDTFSGRLLIQRIT